MIQKKKAQVDSLAGGILALVIAAFFLIMGIIAIQSVGDSTAVYSSNSESILLNSGSSQTLAKTPTSSISAITSNQTWLSFDGVNDRATFSDNFNYSQNEGFTISFWINKTQTTDSAAGYMLCKSFSTGQQRTFQFHSNSGNDVWFVVSHNGSSTNITTSQANNLIGANTWYHVAGQWNGTATRLYLNGVLIDSDSTANREVYSSSANLTIGNCQSNLGYYNGSVDDIRLYNKTLSTVEINDIYLKGMTTGFVGSLNGGYYDDFSSYAVGNDTMKPNWLPQYTSYANITSDGKLQMDYLIEDSGDRDLHITLNRSEISTGIQNLTVTYDFNTTRCNQTFYAIEGVSPIASSGYFYYFDGDNFISYEIKTNATSTNCGSGNRGQVQLYKRVGGVTTSLLPQTFYTFAMNITYPVNVSFKTHNATHYNLSLSFDSVSVSSDNISVSEVQAGYFLLEVAGTSTLYDNVNITRSGFVQTPNGYLRLNENTGTALYDRYGLEGIGDSDGATWNDDGVDITLTNGADYSISGDTFTLLNSLYSYSLLTASYTYQIGTELRGSIDNTLAGLGSFADFWDLIVLALVIVVVIGLLIITFGRNNQR